MSTLLYLRAHRIRSPHGVDGDRRRAAVALTVFLSCMAMLAALIALSVGPIRIDVFSTLFPYFASGAGDHLVRDNLVLTEIRMPRVLMAMFVGGALAAAGAMLQGLFRNPLADPGLVGVSAGAALAAVTVIVVGDWLFPNYMKALKNFALPVAAIAGGLGTTLLLYGISTRQGRTSTATMLLAGIALAALAGAVTGIFVYMSTDQQLRDLTFWSLGSFGGATWEKLGAAIPFLVPIFVVAPFVGHGLNGLLLGEAQARHIGIDSQKVKRTAVACIALAVGASVAVSGVIGFVGIVVPHLLRLMIGPDHRFLLPTSVLFGAILVVAADTVARTIVTPAELPIGIITALFGAPFFLWLLLRKKSLLDV